MFILLTEKYDTENDAESISVQLDDIDVDKTDSKIIDFKNHAAAAYYELSEISYSYLLYNKFIKKYLCLYNGYFC
jgi:hypothetical protein